MRATTIDDLVALLDQLDQYPHEYVDFGAMGPVTADVLRKITKFHTAHHLRSSSRNTRAEI
jgi:hypothetical protein